MAKQIQVWEAKDGEIFDTEAETIEHEAKEEIRTYSTVRYLSESDFDLLHRILDDSEMAKRFVRYGDARAKANAERENKNKRPKEIQEVLDKEK